MESNFTDYLIHLISLVSSTLSAEMHRTALVFLLGLSRTFSLKVTGRISPGRFELEDLHGVFHSEVSHYCHYSVLSSIKADDS